MPELAEVEYFRRQWNPGLGERITRVHINAGKRVTRGIDAAALTKTLISAKLQSSATHGKQMMFRFSNAWLGVHLGMTGKLSVEKPDYTPAKHDHLVLFQAKRALVFNDFRQFGRIKFHAGKDAPEWWSDLPPQPHEPKFTRKLVEEFFARRSKVPAKAVLLMQEAFPGIGNWMADEILWRARINPKRRVESLAPKEVAALWKETRAVSRDAIKHIAPEHGDPPKGWLFHVRWGRKGLCPRDGTPLKRAEVGGRTTAWCEKCQPLKAAPTPRTSKKQPSSSPR